jgi:Abortive infection C-terminus
MRQKIPQSVLALVAEHTAATETHASLDNLYIYAGCPGDPPDGSKPVKALAWLRAVNADEQLRPLDVLGKVIEGYMEKPYLGSEWTYAAAMEFRKKVTVALATAGLQYLPGGTVAASLAAPTRDLETFIRERNITALSVEFERAASKADKEPREAVSAAANILESLFKHYIEAQKLNMPSKQVLGDLWNVVRKDLGFDPSQVSDDDLRGILAGLIQVVQGLAAFRTHASSAHGAGSKSYRLAPRHSRLAIHSAHTVALFVLESWDKKKSTYTHA